MCKVLTAFLTYSSDCHSQYAGAWIFSTSGKIFAHDGEFVTVVLIYGDHWVEDTTSYQELVSNPLREVLSNIELVNRWLTEETA